MTHQVTHHVTHHVTQSHDTGAPGRLQLCATARTRLICFALPQLFHLMIISRNSMLHFKLKLPIMIDHKALAIIGKLQFSWALPFFPLPPPLPLCLCTVNSDGHFGLIKTHQSCMVIHEKQRFSQRKGREHLSNLPSHHENGTHQGISISQPCYEDTLSPEKRFLNEFKMFFSNHSNIFLLIISNLFRKGKFQSKKKMFPKLFKNIAQMFVQHFSGDRDPTLY